MRHHIIHSSQFTVNRWSGGTTAELFIYPEESSYANRDFDFRLSIATIEVASSDFTPLPGVSRTTLILEGEIELIHHNRYSKLLGKFDQDSYDGGWKSSSKGMCTDFNLMTRNGVQGTIEIQKLLSGQTITIPSENSSEMMFVFLQKGRLQLDNERIETGSLVRVISPSTLAILAEQSSEIIVCRIKSAPEL